MMVTPSVIHTAGRGGEAVMAQSLQPSVGQAPGRLRVVQQFVNTLDVEAATDKLDSPAALAGWLGSSGVLVPGAADGLTADDLALARELREALRGVLRSHVRHADGESSAAATARMADVAASLDTRFDVGADGLIRLAPAGSGVRAALADILLIAAMSAAEGTWERLKVCSADDCQWAFYDRSPTRNGCWCSMQICGSRAKSRAYRSRTAASPRAIAGGDSAGQPGHRTRSGRGA
jgi:predicted RNA-binding Zn ribbon-like protein